MNDAAFEQITARAGENRGVDWARRHARGRGFRPGGTDAETSARAGRDTGTRHGGRCRHARRETAKGRISAAFPLHHACATLPSPDMTSNGTGKGLSVRLDPGGVLTIK